MANVQIWHYVFYGATCSSRPYETGWKSQPGGGTKVCHNGCAYISGIDAGSPNGFSFDPTGDTCTNDDHPAPEPDGDGGDDGGGGSEIPGDGDGGGGNDGGGDGNNGGGNNGGGNGDGDGDGEGDGDGDDDGDGNGDGGGNLPGDGDGEGEGEEDGPGEATPPDGKLYKKTDKTVKGVLSDFREGVMKTQMVGGISDFMQVPGGGACPVFTVAASKFWRSMTINFHCSGDFLALLRACGYVIFAIAGYAAVRIALT